jgi:hypothetical protein
MVLIDEYMCSVDCPCPADAEAKYTTLWGTDVGKERFKVAKRFFENDAPAGVDATYKKLVFDSSGTTYKQFSKCYEGTLETKFKEDTDQRIKDAYGGFKKDGLAYFKSMEKKY